MKRPSIPLSASLVLFLMLTLTSCGTVTKPDSGLLEKPEGEKQLVCIVLPEPDWNDPSSWMKRYNVAWTKLGCAQ